MIPINLNVRNGEYFSSGFNVFKQCLCIQMKYFILFVLFGLAKADCDGTTWQACAGDCFWDNGSCYIMNSTELSSYDAREVSDSDLSNVQPGVTSFKVSDDNGVSHARYYEVISVNGDTATISYCNEDNGWFHTATGDPCTTTGDSHTENIFLLVQQYHMIVDTYFS